MTVILTIQLYTKATTYKVVALFWYGVDGRTILTESVHLFCRLFRRAHKRLEKVIIPSRTVSQTVLHQHKTPCRVFLVSMGGNDPPTLAL